MLSSILRNPLVRRTFSARVVSQNEYETAADSTLEKLSDYFDQIADSYPVSDQFDVSHAMGVLTVNVSKSVGENMRTKNLVVINFPGTYVINKQSPNKQIWLSSPMSGPKRYNLAEEDKLVLYGVKYINQNIKSQLQTY